MSKKKNNNKKIIAGVVVVLGLIFGGSQTLPELAESWLNGDDATTILGNLTAGNSQISDNGGNTGSLPYNQATYDELAALDFVSGGEAVVTVNDNQASLNIADWQTNHAVYGNLDELNRTTFVTAYIDETNLGSSENRGSQVWQPTGWHQKEVDGQPIYNRGHLLAYTSSFNLDEDGNYLEGAEGSEDNPKNLATQSAYSNQQVQTKFEAEIREAQKVSGNRVLYQIVTVFRGDELMPRGYWLQAVDSAGTLDFNVYEFNVQPNVIFDYSDGSSKIDRSMTVAE
ncbi:DNA/RNA non-specific endonuclease [Enterococcus sp. LJL120]